MKMTFKKTFIFMTVLMLSAVSCSNTVKKAEISTDSSSVNSSNNSQGESIQEKKEDIILTMAMSGNTSGIDKAIKEFNEADNGYQIQIKRYFDQFNEDGSSNVLSEEEYQYKDLEVLQDIMNTTNIDIVCNASFIEGGYYDILQNKGAFVDLYTFMENDSEVNSDSLDMHVLSLNEIHGKLYSMPTFYTINGLYGESKYVGTKENWTFDEFVEHWNAMPVGTTLMGSTDKMAFFDVVLRNNLNSFVDYKNAQVHFDSPEFKKMLEFCNQFEQRNTEKPIYDYDAPSMLSLFIARGIMNAHLFDKDNGITWVGFPSNDKNGAYLTNANLCYSICASSSPEKQKGAWEFIRTFVTKEWQIENAIPLLSAGGIDKDYYSEEIGLCINKNAFDEIGKRLINKEYYPETFSDGNDEYNTRFPTEKEVKELRRYIDSIDRWGTLVSGSISEIVYDEVTSYFAGGQTIDETIEHIQNRASIWVSEQS